MRYPQIPGLKKEVGEWWMITYWIIEPHTVMVMDRYGNFGAEFRDAQLFASWSAAHDHLTELEDSLPGAAHRFKVAKVRDHSQLVYYVKKAKIPGYKIHTLEAHEVWMDRQAPLGEGMFLEREEAVRELKKAKAEQIRYHQEAMMQISRLNFDPESVPA